MGGCAILLPSIVQGVREWQGKQPPQQGWARELLLLVLSRV
jgi:hypothetical protein